MLAVGRLATVCPARQQHNARFVDPGSLKLNCENTPHWNWAARTHKYWPRRCRTPPRNPRQISLSTLGKHIHDKRLLWEDLLTFGTLSWSFTSIISWHFTKSPSHLNEVLVLVTNYSIFVDCQRGPDLALPARSTSLLFVRSQPYDFVTRPLNEWTFSCPTRSCVFVTSGG